MRTQGRWRGIRSRAALRALALLATASIAPAQGGWTTEKHADLGLTFPRARNYEQIPTQPDERYRVLYFAEKATENGKDAKRIRPELNVLWFDRLPERAPVTGEGAGAGPQENPAEKTKPAAEGAKADEDAKPVDGVEAYLQRYYPKWRLGKPTEGKERGGCSAREFPLTPGRELDVDASGWVYALTRGGRTIAFLGFCGIPDYKDQVRIWRYSAEHVEISEPEEQSTDKLQRMYAKLTLPHPEYRIGVRQKLVRGWKAEDTEHYIVTYDTPDQPLVRKIVRDLELLHAEYEKLFPPTAKMDAVSTVRICKNADEYLSYGGAPHTAGYWNSAAEELVLFDAETIEKHVRSTTDTFVALYHEAFHQYIHYSSGEIPPHSWFNEGHGDFFSGASVKDGKVKSIGVNPWRIATVKAMVAREKTIPWKEIVRFEQKQYYDPAKVGLCYAEGWSIIYFLRKSKVVEKRPEWARILPRYFETLQADYAERLESLKAAGKREDKAAVAEAGVQAREKAVAAAFAGVDMDEIEAAWMKFVTDLEVPKRG